MRSLAIGIARNSQEVVRLAYEFATPHDIPVSQCCKVDFDIPHIHFFAICLRFLEIARLPNEFVRQSYEFVQQPCERRTKLTMTLGLDIIHLAYLVVVIILHSVDNMPPKKGDSLKGNMLACNKYALKCIM